MTDIYSPFHAAAKIAPEPADRDNATREAWIRHYAALALASWVVFHDVITRRNTNPQPDDLPDISFLAVIGSSSTAAAIALTHPDDAPTLIWDYTPEAGALNGEFEDWLEDVLVRHGINPAHIDHRRDAGDFTPTPA